MKKIKGKIAVLLIIMAAVNMLGGISVKAAGGSSSLGVSASSVNIGDTVNVTLNVSTDVYASFHMAISYPSDILEYTGSNKSGDCNGGGGALSVLSEIQAGSTYSISISFRAIAPGSASVSATAVEAIAMETAEAISIGGASASVTVNNAAGGGGNPGGGNTGGGDTGGGNPGGGDNGGGAEQPQEPPKSADNSLKSLTISPGSLSPDFKPSTTKYTASVGADVTSIAVDAQVSNSKATVESVSGNTNLEMGENKVKIVVKAENGTTATYTITVTRGGAMEEPDDEPEEPEEPNEEPENPMDTGIRLNGISYEVSETLPEEPLPEEFSKATATYGGKEVEAYTFPYKDLTLFYLIPAAAEGEDTELPKTGRFYFYHAAANQFFPYINIAVGNTYVLVLPATLAETEAPKGYRETTVTILDETVGAYQPQGDSNTAEDTATGETDDTAEDTAAGEADDTAGDTATGETGQAAAFGPSEFYLVYGVNKNGTSGWYQYDAVEGSLQRYHQTALITGEEEPERDMEAYNKAYDDLENRYKKEKSNARLTIAVLIFLLVAAIFAIINILIFAGKGKGRRKRKKGQDEDIDYIDLDDL